MSRHHPDHATHDFTWPVIVDGKIICEIEGRATIKAYSETDWIVLRGPLAPLLLRPIGATGEDGFVPCPDWLGVKIAAWLVTDPDEKAAITEAVAAAIKATRDRVNAAA